MCAIVNECIPFYEPGGTITGHCSAAVTGKRFVKISDDRQSGPGLADTAEGSNYQVAPADAGDRAFGVASYDAAQGKKVPVIVAPGTVVPVVADGAITAFEQVEVGATGKAKALDSGVAVGTCLTGAGNGDDAEIQLGDGLAGPAGPTGPTGPAGP